MARLKRLFYILLLNVLVSATVTLAVLYYWECRHPPEVQDVVPIVMVITNPAGTAVIQIATTPESGTSLAAASPDLATATRPAPKFATIPYQVRAGDTLGTIANTFNVSVADVLSVNDLADPDAISVGQVINIPNGPLPTATRFIPSPTVPTATTTPHPTTRPTATSTPTRDTRAAQVKIETVIGLNDLAQERLKIVHAGGGEVSLQGWQLDDGNGHVYSFPQLDLFAGGFVYVHTQTGLDTATDLYWGLAQPVWGTGGRAVLRDAQGSERAAYTIP